MHSIIILALLSSTNAAFTTDLISVGRSEYRLKRFLSSIASNDIVIFNAKSGSLALTARSDDFYTLNIFVGTPNQKFYVLPTTFNAGLWLIDSECEDAGCKGNSKYIKHRFHKDLSSTFSATDDLFDGGSFEATIVSDVLTLGNLSAQQTFALAYQAESSLAKYQMDGVIGLGWPRVNMLRKAKTPLQNLMPLMDEPIFTLWLKNRTTVKKATPGGQMTFGTRDTTNCDTNWIYTNLTSLDVWQFQISGFSVGGGSINRRKRPAAVVTEFFGIMGPIGNVNNIIKATNATLNDKYGVYTVACDSTSTSTLPDLIFKLDQSELRIPASQYVQDWSDTINLGSNQCMVAVFGFENYGWGPAWYFGNTWSRTYCSLFDVGNQRMGFASVIQQQ